MEIRRYIIIAAISAVLIASVPLPAECAESKVDGGGDVSVFKSETRFDLDEFKRSETLRLGGKRLDSPLVSSSQMARYRSSEPSPRLRPGGKKKIAIAAIASALLPGLGELYVYFDSKDRSALIRAPLFMALDGYLWYSYKDNYDKGKDFKRQYEEYCDEHWSEARFLEQHPVCYGLGGCTDWEEYNEVGPQMQKFFFIYIPKALDKEEYYENCGKYDAFAFGWDDWDQEAWLLSDQTYETFKPIAWTPNRTHYWSLRDESDHYLIRADQFIMGAIINRVVSMIDAAWLAYQVNRGTAGDSGLTLDVVPGTHTSTIGLSYRF